MAAPPVAAERYAAMIRCVFRTLTEEGYKDVMGRPPGTYSLQSAIAQHHTLLTLHQVLPGTSTYPSMRVVDLLPATHCTLPVEAAVTMVVLPPSTFTEKHEHSSGMDMDDRVMVRLNSGLSGSAAYANRRALDDLILEDDAMVKVCSSSYACLFSVNAADGGDAESSTVSILEVGAELFRNIRAAYYGDPAHALVTSSSSSRMSAVSFSDVAMRLPVDAFLPLEESTGELMRLSKAAPTLQLSKMVLCPAIDDEALTELYGLHYPDLCALFSAISATAWEGRLVSTGDILCLELGPLDSVAKRLDGVDVLENITRVLSHKVRYWKDSWVDELGSSRHLLALRVVRLESAAGVADFGLLRNCGGMRDAVEVALVHQRNYLSTDVTPIRAPSPSNDLGGVGVYTRVCDGLRSVFAPSLNGGVHTFVVHGIKENLPREFVECAIDQFGLSPLVASAEGMEEAELEDLLRKFLGEVCTAATVLILHNAHTIATSSPHLLSLMDELSDGASKAVRTGPRAVFLLCESMEAVPPMIAARATNAEGVIECGNPSEEDRAAFIAPLLWWCCSRYRVHASLLLSPKTFAGWTVGLAYADLLALVEECVRDAAYRTPCMGDAMAVVSDVSCEPVVQAYLKTHGYSMVSTKLQPVRWSDVGGLEDAKRELRETIQLPILHPELFENGMKKRTGVLFYGPPGCGKTLLAKAVATEMNMNFMSVKGPELINQYVGESEKNIRLLFQRARDNSPCIVFFDELDALAPARGAKGDAGGVMDRIVSQLLVEVDGVGQKRSDGTASGDVFIIGATNRPDLLDAALLRPGRFDRLCYLGIPSTRAEQLFALKALTRKFDLNEDVDLESLLEPLEMVYTGADFFALCSDAMMFAVEDALEAAQQQAAGAAQGLASSATLPAASDEEESKPIKVCMEHFVRARAQLKPSVTKNDLRRYESLKEKFKV